jgi:hypothetical protein
MTAHDHLFVSDALASAEPTTPLPNWIGSIGLRLAAWAQNRADNWEAAALYEQLSALSDTELTRRGLSTCERSADA